MARRTLSTAVLLLAGLTGASSDVRFPEPELRERNASGVLETTLTVDVLRYAAENVTFNTRAYEGQIPGPTLKVAPGDTLIVHLVNALGDNDPDLVRSFPAVTTHR